MRALTGSLSIVVILGICGALHAEPGRVKDGVAARRELKEYRVFVLEPGQRRVEIGRSFIIPATDTVTVDGNALRRGDEYRINTLKGSLILVQPALGGEKLVIGFSRYPFSFSPVLASRFLEGVGAYPPAVHRAPTPRAEERSRRDPYRLRFSGSKTVGFSVGSNKDLGIDQSLKVSMVGKVAKDLEVKAFLTDDNLPVQPEGNTEELKHFDRVSVEIASKHAQVQLGDFATGLSWSRFSSFQRELRGVHTRLSLKGQTLFAGGGIAKGRFQTVNFFGREGVQGPYELLPARRFNGLIILPGTELVYFNGRLLKRGSENEYTIDYNRGSVTFTEKVTVTDDAEIVIDFQTGEDEYERSTVAAGWISPRVGEALTLRAFFFQESDDSDRPVRGGLSEEERFLISEAGDDAGRAVAGGITQVEAGRGNYILVPADTLPERFVFVESGGEYVLNFYEVGPGNGDYRSDGFTTRGEVKYAFAGEGGGDYSIGRPLSLPQRKRLFTLGAAFEKGRLFMDTEGSMSFLDKNVLSQLDDGDNRGGALKVEGGLRDAEIAGTKLSLVGEFSTLEGRFSSPDKRRESYFYRNWNLEDVSLEGRENIGGATLHLRSENRWDLEGSYKYLSRGTDLTARKGEVTGSLGDLGSRGVRFRTFDTETGASRDRRFASGEAVFSFWRLVPRVSMEAERYRNFVEEGADTGRFYYQGTVTLGSRNTGAFSGTASYRLRRTDFLEIDGTEWFRARENDEIRFDGAYAGGGRILELFLTHRRNRQVREGATGWYNLARLRYRDSWERAGVTTDLGYRISAGEDRRLEKAVIFVGENQGDYDSEGREVGQKRGDYMVLYLPGGDTERVRTVEATWRLSFGRGLRGLQGGEGGSGWYSWIRRNVSLDNFFSVTERSRTDDLVGLYTLKPELLQRDDVTIYGVNKLRQEWSFFNDVKRFNLRVTFTREDEEDNRSQGIPSERFNREVIIRAESAPRSALSLSWQLGTKLRERDSAGPSGQDYRVEALMGSQLIDYRIRPSTRLSSEFGFERRKDEVSAAKQTSYSVTPSLVSSIGTKVHVTTFVKFTYTNAEVDLAKPLFFLEEGLRYDWSIIGQYRFTRNINFGVNYIGRREKNFLGEMKTIHDLKMESRAYF
ncbi:MAG: hypothetical protein JSV33_06880 [bacterium]|nr:MAG: hypothetical protein JSV33_06880 [bacterium]